LVSFVLPLIPVFPIRLAILIPLAATAVSPLVVAVVAAVGASLGTIPLYLLGRLWPRHPPSRRPRRWLKIWLWLERHLFLAIVIFALFPLPDQVVSSLSGWQRYPLSRMLIAFFLGRLPYFLLLALAGYYWQDSIRSGWQAFLRMVGG